MSHIQLLIDRVGRLRTVLEPKPKPVRMLPDLWLDEDGNDQPGHEEENERARRFVLATGLEVKEYYGFNPDEEGSEQ